MRGKSELNSNFKEKAEKVRRLFAERGSDALKAAERNILKEDIGCKEIRQALVYFMSGWRDVTRPALISLSCEAVGGNPEITVPVGSSLILISGGIDIHDDIIDETMMKGTRQTVLGKFGRDVALLTGNALIVKGLTSLYSVVSKLQSRDTSHILNDFKRLLAEMNDGEAIELRFRGQRNINPKEYIEVVRKKAADVEAYTRLGAFLGGGSKEEVEALGKYGRILGMIAILRDDLADMLDIGEMQRRTVKESLPLPLIYALRNREVERKIKTTLQNGLANDTELETLFSLIVKGKGILRLTTLLNKLKEEATASVRLIKRNREIFKKIIDVTLPPSY